MTEELIPFEDLVEAYRDCRRYKRNKKSALQFEQNWSENLIALHREINEGTYRIGQSTAFVVRRPTIREIFAADFRDRVVHHLLRARLEPLFERYFIEDAYSCRNGKGTLYGIQRLYIKIYEESDHYTKDCWVGKFDLKGFFYHIHKPTLWGMLKEFIEERYHGKDKNVILWLVEMCVMHNPQDNCKLVMPESAWDDVPDDKSLLKIERDYGLAIGNLVSQMFANFYLTKFDQEVSKYFAYGRYVDDFFLISKDKGKILSYIPTMRTMLGEIHMTLHPKKLYLQHYSKGVRFIGGICKPGRSYIINRTVHSFAESLKEFGNQGVKLDNVRDLICTTNSYMGFLSCHHTYAIRRNMMNLMPAETWEYCHVIGNCNAIRLNKKYKERLTSKLYSNDKKHDQEGRLQGH